VKILKKYDLLIIGCGASGFAAAIKASELTEGKIKIGMVCKGLLGGTCVNVGCVPSKYLIEITNKYYLSRKKFIGLELSAKINFTDIMGGLKKVVKELREEKYEKVLNYYSNVDLIKGDVTFIEPNKIRVNTEKGEQELSGSKIIIGVGSRPAIPPIQGLQNVGYITSDTVWDLKELPHSLLVIGGGAIGLEIGQALARLGSEVTVVEVMDRILPSPYFEPEISYALTDYLEDEGLNIYTKSTVTMVSKEGDTKVVEISTKRGKQRLEVDEILVATGRRPNTENLELEKAGITTDQKGYILVDKFLQTSNPIVYAAGDCIAKSLMLETLAAKEGVLAATNAIKGNIETIDYSTTPIVVFTDPQVASVGLTEDELMKREKVCSCRILKLDYVAKARLIGDTRGFVKLVVNPKDGTVVGVHILSPLASEIIMEGVVLVKNKVKLEELVETTHVFPTISESIKLAAQSFIRDPSKMSCCVE